MNFNPLGNRVLLKPLEKVQESKSGIIIPDTAKEKPQEGEVVSIGKDVTEVAPNDIILYGKYSGTELKFDGQAYILISQDDILGVLEQ